MIRLNTKYIATPTQVDLDKYKKYASISDCSQDELLMSLLSQAISLVQKAADKSVVAASYELVESERENNTPVKLYQTVSEITSVKDGHGNPLGYSLSGHFLIPDFPTETVVVEYETAPDGDASLLLPTVWQFATALYDGAEQQELLNILRSC